MRDEADDQRRLEDARFRALLIALHPGQAKEILAALDGQPTEVDGIPQYAPEMTEEEMDDYQPFSVEEAQQTIDLMRRFGGAMVFES